MNRSECPDVSPVTPELWDRIRAGLKKTAGHGLSDCPFSIYNLPIYNLPKLFLDISPNSDIISRLADAGISLLSLENEGHLSKRRCKHGKGYCQL